MRWALQGVRLPLFAITDDGGKEVCVRRFKMRYTVEEASELLGVPTRILRRFIDAERLPATKTQGSLNHVVKRRDLIEWADGQGVDTSPLNCALFNPFAGFGWIAAVYYLLLAALLWCIFTTD